MKRGDKVFTVRQYDGYVEAHPGYGVSTKPRRTLAVAAPNKGVAIRRAVKLWEAKVRGGFVPVTNFKYQGKEVVGVKYRLIGKKPRYSRPGIYERQYFPGICVAARMYPTDSYAYRSFVTRYRVKLKNGTVRTFCSIITPERCMELTLKGKG